jgi:hexosaminidase
MCSASRLLTILLLGATYIPHTVSLWPIPRSLQTGSSALILSNSFSIDIQVPNAPKDLTQAAARTHSYLKNDQLGRLVVGRGASDASLLHGAEQLKSLQLTLSNGAGKAKSISAEAIAPIASRSEEYNLVIPSTGGHASLSANSTLGLFRGLSTFEQLWYESNGVLYTLEAPIDITDSPAFVCSDSITKRALMNFISLSVVSCWTLQEICK